MDGCQVKLGAEHPVKFGFQKKTFLRNNFVPNTACFSKIQI